MKVDSSFFRLFRQSRYGRNTEDEQDQPRQNRRELFAVAAVAFVAKHDERFARDFLLRVGGVPDMDLGHEFIWEPQKAFCADLLITDCDSGNQYVVEFKVGAPLMGKQGSDGAAFDRKGGYGRAIKNQFPNARVYTALAQQRDFEDSIKDRLERRARTWKELIPTDGKESPLLQDLLNSLGELGISILRLRRMQNMRKAKFVSSTIDIHDLLQSILEEFREVPLDVDSDEFYSWVGMYVRPRQNQLSELRKWLGHDWPHIAWVGYLLPKDGKEPELSVWLSFEDKLASRRKESIRALQKVIRKGEVEPSPKFNDLIVKIIATRIPDERKWFTETLQLVLQHAKPRTRKA